MLLLNNSTNAQCVVNTCTTPTLNFSSSATLSGTLTWSGECVDIGSGVVLTVSGSLTISSSQLRMGAGSSIEVDAGGVLVMNNTDLYPASTMWDGIELLDDGAITINNSRVAGSYIGVEAHISSASSTTALTITNSSCLLNNEIGVLVEAGNPSDISLLIEDTEISGASLPAPKSGEPADYGILFMGILFMGSISVSTTAAFRVGNTATYTGSATSNYIHDVAIGIRSYYANTEVQNCRISNTLTTTYLPTSAPIAELSSYASGNIGILATSDNTSPNLERTLVVGLSLTGPGVINNLIDNVTTDNFDGIVAESQVNTTILSNTINGGLLGGSNYVMRRGIQVLFPKSDHIISNNTISGFDGIGIRMIDITNGMTSIKNNSISRVTYPSGTEVPIGISVNGMPTSSHAVSINDNTIEKVKTGIFIRNHAAADVIGNSVTYSRGGSGGTAYGIQAENDSDLELRDNYLESDCSTCALNRIGIEVTDCSGVVIHGNYLYNTSVGTMISASAVNGNMNCNEFHDCRVGVGLDDIEVSVFGGFEFGVLESGVYYINNGTGVASDNSWYPTTTANRERHFGSTDVQDLNWRYRDLLSDLSTSAPEYDIPTALTVPPIGASDQFTAVLTNTTNPECGYLFRISDLLTLEDALEYMEQAYANAGSLVDAPVTASEYYRRWEFWQEVHSWEGLDELLSDDLSAYYISIATSNIPIFQEIQDSISRSNYVYANALNSSVAAETSVEEYLQDAYSIYLNRVDENGKYALTDEDRYALLEMAQSDPNEYGMGVHVAAAMLDTILYKEYVFEEDIEFENGRLAISDVSVYPNPVEDQLTVVLATSETGLIAIYNISGNCIYSTSLSYGTNIIDLGALTAGVYLVKVHPDNGVVSSQLIYRN